VALESRDRWVRAAEGWAARADPFARDTLPVSAALVDAVNPQPGQTILDLAAGLGDTGYLAYARIQPGGELITSDFVPEMLNAAQKRAPANANIRFRQMDMSVPLDQPTATIDGIVCRWGFMLLHDPEFALREARRLLKQDGRLALAAWTGPDDNLWSAAPVRILTRRGILEKPDPAEPGQFTWANADDIEDTMATAGFIDPEIRALDFTMRYDDVDDWWVHVTSTSTRIKDADEQMDFATRSDVLAELEEASKPFEQPDDRLEIPARTWIASATA
jgi:SAM-dependent methyltransferase